MSEKQNAEQSQEAREAGSELKGLVRPCPFCGGTHVEVMEGSTFRWRVAFCCECGAQAGEARVQTLGDGTREGWEAKGRADAIAEWNTRTA